MQTGCSSHEESTAVPYRRPVWFAPNEVQINLYSMPGSSPSGQPDQGQRCHQAEDAVFTGLPEETQRDLQGTEYDGRIGCKEPQQGDEGRCQLPELLALPLRLLRQILLL